MRNTNKMFIERLKDFSALLSDNTDSENHEQVLAEMEDLLHGIVDDYNKGECEGVYMFTEEKKQDIFAEGDFLKLCCFKEEDRADFIRLAKQTTILPKAFEEDGFEDELWNDMFEDNAFYTVIRRSSDNAFVGYCGIKNLKKNRWELAIELLEEFRHQGYGKSALHLYMARVNEITGVNSFIATVDGENIASQRLCEALGGKPNGIAEYLLHDKNYLAKYEQEHFEEVTDAMREVAKRFDVTPEKLLTHVLVYKFEV